MWRRRKKEEREGEKRRSELPVKDISITELKTAIRKYSSQLPPGVPLSVLIEEDLRINYQLLAPYLRAIPSKMYFMSIETYEIFEEDGYELAIEIDMVQQAVDKYTAQTGELPVIEDDPYHKVSYYKLKRTGLLSIAPQYDYYITDQENLITYIQPE